MLIADVGFFRTKAFVVSADKGLERSLVCDTAAGDLLERLESHLRQAGRKINRYLLMKELELDYPRVRVEGEIYDAGAIMRDSRWDLSKNIAGPVAALVKEHFEQSGRWPDAFAVTGGGALLSGEVIGERLKAEGCEFKETIIDPSPRYSVLTGMRESAHGHKRS